MAKMIPFLLQGIVFGEHDLRRTTVGRRATVGVCNILVHSGALRVGRGRADTRDECKPLPPPNFLATNCWSRQIFKPQMPVMTKCGFGILTPKVGQIFCTPKVGENTRSAHQHTGEGADLWWGSAAGEGKAVSAQYRNMCSCTNGLFALLWTWSVSVM